MLVLERVWDKQNRTPVMMVSGGAILVIALADWWTPVDVSLGFLYVFPVMLAAGFLSRWGIIAVGTACAGLTELFGPVDKSLVRLAFEVVAITGSALFVAELLRNRRLNLEAAESVRILIETSPAAVVTINEHCIIERANRAASELIQPSDAHLIGQPIALFLPELGLALRPEGGPHFRASMRCRGFRGDGHPFSVDVWFSTFRVGAAPKLAAIIAEIAEEEETQVRDAGARNHQERTPLNDREREALCLVVQGLANKEMAVNMCISESVVKNIGKNMLDSAIAVCEDGVHEQPAIDTRDADYIRGLWWVMHHSDDPQRATLALTSYLDDSGTDEGSPVTAIGGPVMRKEAFEDFSAEWIRMLHRYRIPRPLHMNDFVRPHGKHIGMPSEMKLALFAEVALIVNQHKLYSISVGVPQSDFRQLLSEEVCKKVTGPYAFAFFCTVVSNGSMGERIAKAAPELMESIAYLIDCGFAFPDQLWAVHSALLRVDQVGGRFSYVGSMAFDTDDRVPALQAADAIAWSSRRKAVYGNLSEEYAPLEMLLTEKYLMPSGKNSLHLHIPLDPSGIEKFARPINNWLSLGVLPSFSDLLR